MDPQLRNLNVFQVLNCVFSFLVLVAAEVQVYGLHHLPFMILYIFINGLLLVFAVLQLCFVKGYVGGNHLQDAIIVNWLRIC